jgi:hypothetical protein
MAADTEILIARILLTVLSPCVVALAKPCFTPLE